MKLSGLQKYILRNVWNARPTHLNRKALEKFYQPSKSKPSEEQRIKIITRSLERLIARGLLTAYGHKTQEKFFIEDVKLTIAGRRLARELAGRQMPLPLPVRRKRSRRK